MPKISKTSRVARRPIGLPTVRLAGKACKRCRRLEVARRRRTRCARPRTMLSRRWSGWMSDAGLMWSAGRAVSIDTLKSAFSSSHSLVWGAPNTCAGEQLLSRRLCRSETRVLTTLVKPLAAGEGARAGGGAERARGGEWARVGQERGTGGVQGHRAPCACKCGMPRTSPDATTRTPVSFAQVRGRQPPSFHANPRGAPRIVSSIPAGVKSAGGDRSCGNGPGFQSELTSDQDVQSSAKLVDAGGAARCG